MQFCFDDMGKLKPYKELCYPKPFLKWAGGKTQLIPTIEKHFPKDILESKEIENYVEPFIGGGALFFYLMREYKVHNSYISDINKDLILTYQVIKKNPKKLISLLETLAEEYASDYEKERKKFYYQVRDLFNETLSTFDYDNYSKQHIIRASQMIFLNKTCYNGLFRVNKKGEFNVPCAYPENPLICDKKNILTVSEALEKTIIVNASYSDSEQYINKNSLVYLDPPYRPLNPSSFIEYSKSGFNDNDQIKLGEFYKKINDKGAKALLSNSDPKNVDVNDNFFDDIYADFKIYRVKANRFINSKADKRGPIKEILVSNF